MSDYAKILREWAAANGPAGDGPITFGLDSERDSGSISVWVSRPDTAGPLHEGKDFAVSGHWTVEDLLDKLYAALAADPLPVGTVLRAGDPEPPDGTVLMLPDDTYELYDSALTEEHWPLFAARYGPFVVGPDYTKLVGGAE